MKYQSFSSPQKLFLAGIFSFLFINLAQAQVPLYGTVTGGNTINVTVPGNYGGTYYTGHSFIFLAVGSVTSGPVTISVNGATSRPLKKNVTQDLVSGDILDKQAVPVIYDGTNFQVINAGSVASASTGAGTGNLHAFRAYVNGAQTVNSNNVETKTSFDFEEYDQNGDYNPINSRFTPTEAGYYFINVQLGGNAGDGIPNDATISLYKNGVIHSRGARFKFPSSDNWQGQSNFVFYANLGDYFEIYTYAVGTNYNIPLATGPNSCYLNGFKINGGGTLTVTSFSGSTASGISTLNGLTSTSQNFTTSSTGTSVNINSSSSTHNFNIPLVTVVGGNNVTVSGGFPNYTISGLAGGTSTSQWVSTTGGIYYSGGNIGLKINPQYDLHLYNPTQGVYARLETPITNITFNVLEFKTGIYNSSTSRLDAIWQLGMFQAGTASDPNDKMYLGRSGISSTDFAIYRDGNVGIGLSNPGAPSEKLTVLGNISASGIGYFSTIAGLALNGAAVGSIVTVDGIGRLGFGTLPSPTTSQWVSTGTGTIFYSSAGNTERVVIGTPIQANPFWKTTILGQDQGSLLSLFNHSAVSNSGGIINLSRANGSPGSYTPLVTGNQIGAIQFAGSLSGNQTNYAAGIHSYASNNWSNTSTPTRLDFYTTPTNATVTSLAMTLNDTGYLGIGTTPSAKLDVNGNARFLGPVSITGLAGATTQALGVNNLGQLVTISGATAAITSLNTLTTSSQTFSTSSTGSSININSSGSNHNFNIPVVTIVGGNNVTVSGGFPNYTISGLAGGTSTSQWTSTTGGSIYYGGTGYVGINSAIPPIAHLDVNGVALFRSQFFAWADGVNVIGPSGSGKGFIIHEGPNGTSSIGSATGRYYLGMVGGSELSFIGNGLTTSILANNNNIAQMSTLSGGTFAVSGRIGVGTPSPATNLDVNGNARFLGSVSITGLAGATTQALGVNNLGQLVTISGASSAITSINTLTTSSQTFSTSSTGSSININSSGSVHNFNIPVVTIVGGNNVTVSGGFPNYTISGLSGGTSTSQWTSTTGGSIYYGGTGYVGIGTITPNQPLTVQGNSSVTGTGYFGSLLVNNLVGPGTVTVDGLGNLGVTTAAGSALSGSGTANSVAFWANGTTLTADGLNFAFIRNNFVTLSVGGIIIRASTAAGDNLAIGNGAGNLTMTSAANNTMYGKFTGSGLTTGQDNVFVGAASGRIMTNGSQNSFFGSGSGYNQTGGNGNAIFGADAGFQGISVSFNSYFGTEAGNKTTGSNNTFLGRRAGYTNTTGAGNVAIGYGADMVNINQANSIAIGFNSTVGGNNMMALGGTGANAVSVGIGTGLPQNTIDVVGGARIRNLSISGAVFANASGDLFINTTSSANLWTVSGTSLTPSTSTYGINIGTTSGNGLNNIFSTATSGLVVNSINLPPNTGAIMAYSYTSSSAGIGAFVTNSNAVGVFGTSSNSLSTGVEGSNNAGGTAIRASGTGSVNPLVTIDQNGTTGTGLRVNLGNGSNTATGLLISTSSPTSQAMDITGKIQLRNYTNGTLTVDGLGNLGVSTSASSAGAGAGFLATSTIPQANISSGTWTLALFGNEVFDDAAKYDYTTTFDYTVPANGVYQINASMPFSNIGQVDIAIAVNGINMIVNSTSTSPNTGIITSIPISGILKLTTNQKVTIQIRQFTGGLVGTASSNTGANGSFSMVKLY